MSNKTLYEKLCEEFPNHAVNSRGEAITKIKLQNVLEVLNKQNEI